METLPLAAVKAKLSEVIDRVEREQDRVTITRNGRPVAVIVSMDDIEGLEETLEILSDKRLMRKIRAGVAAAMKGAAAALEAVHSIAANPRRMGKPLQLELTGLWSARRGPYRIIYSIDDSTDTITITAIAHRNDVY